MNKTSKLENKILDEAYNQAVRVLRNCVHSIGVKASARACGYPQVWARDSMITLLGACLINDKKISDALMSSFNILRKKQSPLGCIPNSVHVKTLKSNFQAYADGGLWFIIGASFLFKQTDDIKFLKRNYSAIQKILTWYEYQNVDQSGFIGMTEAADWEDLLAVRGKGLYVNVLYCLALRNANVIAKALGKKKQSVYYYKQFKKVRSLINKYFWYKGDNNVINQMNLSFGTGPVNLKGYDNLGKKHIFPPKRILNKYSYYLPYLAFRDFGEWFDSFGNLLAVLVGIADKNQARKVLSFIEKQKLTKPHPIKAIYPPIFPGKKDWRYYYKFHNLNLPHRYHNGGIWPFLGGFYVAALVKTRNYRKARQALLSLALSNKNGKESKWEFNEWLHGKNGRPMGMVEQAWSAGMYIYAYETVKRKKLLFF